MSTREYRTYESFDRAFIDLSRELISIEESDPAAGRFVSAPRGQEIKEILAAPFVIENPRHRVLGVPARKFSTEYLAAELVWYFAGHNRCDWIERHASFWTHIQNDDGTLNSAYGDRIFNRGLLKGGGTTGQLDRNQWQMVLDELRKDPDSRRAVIHIRAVDDGFDAKDVPCTLTLQFLLREGRLDMIVHMRSNDLVLGSCYDVPAFTLMQEVMANDLSVELGRYYHFANSLHVYSRHYDMAREAAGEDVHLVRTSNGGMNESMTALEPHVTIDVMREWAAALYKFDIDLDNIAEACSSLADLKNEIARELKKVVLSCDVSLVRDIARLLATSAMKRAAKNRPEWKEEMNQHRTQILMELEDPSIRACTR